MRPDPAPFDCRVLAHRLPPSEPMGFLLLQMSSVSLPVCRSDGDSALRLCGSYVIRLIGQIYAVTHPRGGSVLRANQLMVNFGRRGIRLD